MRKPSLLMQPVMLMLLVLLTGTAKSDELAPQGAKGKLIFSITVKGGGHLESGKVDFDSTVWKADYTLSYSAPFTAQNPTTLYDSEAMAELQGPGLSEEDDAIQAKWDQKMEDCGGDEECENSVLAAMIADPDYQRVMAKMQNVGADAVNVMKQVELGSNAQLWLPPTEKASHGICKVEHEEWRYGNIEPSGGTSDIHTRRTGEMKIGNGSGELNLSPKVTIDKQTMTYKVEFDEKFIVSAMDTIWVDDELRETDKSATVAFFGLAPKSENWKSELTLTGKVQSVSQPNFDGKKTLSSNLGDPKDPHYTFPVTITIEWKFESGS